MRGKQNSQTLPRQTIRDRPPAALPENAEISNQGDQEDQEDNQDYATIKSDISSASDEKLQTAIVYDYVHPKPHTIPRLKDANTALTSVTQRKNLLLLASSPEFHNYSSVCIQP